MSTKRHPAAPRKGHRTRLPAITLAAVALLAVACQSVPDAGFVEQPERMTHNGNFPFKKEWYSEDVDWKRFDSVYIAPVDTTHLLQMNWWQKASLKGDVDQQDAHELGRYARMQLVKRFMKDEKQRFRVVRTPGPNTLVIELSIVEIVPTKVWLNVAEYAGIMAAFDKGYTAIESRWRAGEDGPVIATIADGMGGRATLLSANDVTWWGHSKNAFDEWARVFVAVADSGWKERVRGRLPVALVTW